MEPIELRSPWPAATVLGAPPLSASAARAAPRPPAIRTKSLHYVTFHRCGWPGAAPARTPVRAGTGPGQPRDPGRGEQPDPSDLCL